MNLNLIMNNRYYYSVTMFARLLSCVATIVWSAIAFFDTNWHQDYVGKAYKILGGLEGYSVVLGAVGIFQLVRILRLSAPSYVGTTLSLMITYHWSLTLTYQVFFAPLSPSSISGCFVILIMALVSFLTRPQKHLTIADKEVIMQRLVDDDKGVAND